ncbi:MAG: hypothetical protein QM651_09740 [Rhodoblastus sp.]
MYILFISVACLLLLQASGAIPGSSVGGSMTIALAVFAGALAVAIHEAWTRRRGAVGWIVNIFGSFIGAFLAAPLAGFLLVPLLAPFANGSSFAASGGPVLAIALAGTMVVALLGAWAVLQLANRWR